MQLVVGKDGIKSISVNRTKYDSVVVESYDVIAFDENKLLAKIFTSSTITVYVAFDDIEQLDKFRNNLNLQEGIEQIFAGQQFGELLEGLATK